MLEIEKLVGGARYSDILQKVINELGGEKVLFVNYDSDYQGYVDIDVLLKDGRVFSYYYPYGSCSGCDEWEDMCYSEAQIKDIMTQEATFFEKKWQYNDWVERASRRIKT